MLGRVVVGLWLAILAAVPAAAQDYTRGMEAYRQGDYATAITNWRPLAERGHAAAQSSLGFMYNYGHGVPRDYTEALKWYRRAARQGFPAAQYHLGFLYTKGFGVPQDYLRAHMWFSLGAEGGLAYSDRNRAIVARRMTKEQIAEAKELARQWRAQAKKRAASKASAKRPRKTRRTPPPPKMPEGRPLEQKAEAALPQRKAGAPPPVQVAARATAARDVPVAAVVGEAGNEAGGVGPRPDAANGDRAEHATAIMGRAGGRAKKNQVEVKAERPASKPAPGELRQARRAPHAGGGKADHGSGPILLQFGASKSEALALKAIARIAKAHKKVLGDMEIRAVRKNLGARGVYYRLRAGPIADGAAGKALCRALVARGQSCLVLKP
jgi:hypothetical protein